MFITVTCCKEVAKKLFEHCLQSFTQMFHIYKLLQEEVQKFSSSSSLRSSCKFQDLPGLVL